MYHENGDFGQVRMASIVPTLQNQGLFSLESVGWHRCNDRYQWSRPQGSEEHLILITVGGCGHMTLEGTEYDLPAGTVAFIPRNVPNSYGTPSGKIWEFFWMHPTGIVANEFLDAVARRCFFVREFNADHDFSKRMEKLLSLCQTYTDNSPLKISQKVSELLHLIAFDLCEKPQSESLSAQVISFLEQHYEEPVRIEDIAGSLFVSTAHLTRVFKKENGCTPHQYLMRYRLLTAAELLKFSELQVQEIADRVGFSSSSHFISAFLKRYGCTPVQYQEQSAGKSDE